ncbi:MAG: AAA family ATPase, partial [Gammaproteobacteria bacterium]|nr:AAA family ATPase [Gammaproteobacteria bacterium]
MKNSERSQLVVRHMSQFLLRDSQLTTADAQAVIGQLIRQTVDGHIAINLDQLPELGSGDDTTRISNLREALLKSHIVGSPGDYTPVVLDNSNRLYFYRYWQYEDEVARALREKAVELDDDIDLQKLKAGLDRLFPDIEAAGQRTAAAITALRRLTVVSGGPGTGKTTAVVRILSLLLEMKPELKIAVAAPTGKAAARASAAMIHAGSETEISAELRQRLPGTASTLHRLLGYRAVKNTFNQDNPLPYDVVVIDEASMVGVSMMARLLSALRKNCRLILLGDKDQLSSVEPGSVLGDICNNAAGYSSGFAGILGKLGIETKTRPMTQALQDCVAPLTHSFRFAQGGGIGQLASAIRDGDSDRALEILNDPAMPDVRLHECASIRQTHEALSPSLLAAFADYFSV